MTWDVIVWVKENAVDFVPSIWRNGNQSQYKFPQKLSDQKIRTVIYQCEDIKDFTWHDAIVKKKNIASLIEAKAICEEYKSFTEKSSLSEEKVIRKRKRAESSSDDENQTWRRKNFAIPNLNEKETRREHSSVECMFDILSKIKGKNNNQLPK